MEDCLGHFRPGRKEPRLPSQKTNGLAKRRRGSLCRNGSEVGGVGRASGHGETLRGSHELPLGPAGQSQKDLAGEWMVKSVLGETCLGNTERHR